MFAVQKILARIFFPLPIAFWLAIAAGIVAWRGHAFRTHRSGADQSGDPQPGSYQSGGPQPGTHRSHSRLARGLAIAAVAWLFLISWNPVGDALLGTLESRHAPLEEVPPGITHIVVLGGGAHADEGRPAAVRLSRSSQGRVLEGVRLWRAAAASRASGIPQLIFTGGSPDGRRSMASLGAEAARDLGVPPGYMVTFEEALNTEAEARAVAGYLGADTAGPPNESGSTAGPPNGPRSTAGDASAGGDPNETGTADASDSSGLVLVTSASHMPRAVALFRRAGLDPLPAPAQFLTDSGRRSSWSLLPEAGALAKTERFFYEVLGIVWMRVRG